MSTDSKRIWLSSIISQHITSYPVTLSPRASTIPEHSNPGTRGVLGGLSMFPCRTIKSMKFKPLWMANVERETFRMESKRIHLAWRFFRPFPPLLSLFFLFIYFFYFLKNMPNSKSFDWKSQIKQKQLSLQTRDAFLAVGIAVVDVALRCTRQPLCALAEPACSYSNNTCWLTWTLAVLAFPRGERIYWEGVLRRHMESSQTPWPSASPQEEREKKDRFKRSQTNLTYQSAHKLTPAQRP